MTPEQRIEKLEKQVAELLTWKEARMRQQITFPLDKISKDIITKDLFVWTGIYAFDAVLGDGAICTMNGAPIAVIVSDASNFE